MMRGCGRGDLWHAHHDVAASDVEKKAMGGRERPSAGKRTVSKPASPLPDDHQRTSDAALRDSEHRYHTLTTVAPVGIFRTDAAGATTYVNPYWCDLSGLSADEAMNHDWLGAVHPDDRDRVLAGWSEATARQLPSTTEFRLLRPDGRISWVLGNAVPERDSDGRFVGYIGTLTDVTARVEAEQALESQKHVLELVVAGAPLEETLTALLQFVEQHSSGLLTSILLLDADGQHVRHCAAPSLPEAYVKAIDGAPIGERAGSCGTAAYFRRPIVVEDIATDPLWEDYRHLALPHGLRACWSTPIFDAQGAVLGTFAMYFREPRRPHPQHERLIATATHLAALSIARHREEEELRRANRDLRATFEQAAVGVAQVSPEGHFLRMNDRYAAIAGYTQDELIGRHFADITVADDVATDLGVLRRLLSGEMTTYDVEKRYRRKDGSVVWVHLTTSLVHALDDAPDYFITFIEDVSNRRSLEAQLRQSQKMEAIGLLAGGVAHDFNNFLSVILGHADLSLVQLADRDPLREDMHAIVDAAGRAADITRQLLAFARKETAAPVLLDVNRGIESLRRMLKRLVGEDIELHTLLDRAIRPIRHDPTQFDQVVVNLVTNARDAIGGVGTITLETANLSLNETARRLHPGVPLGDYVMLRVTDTGVGMDASTQEQIFEPFFTTKARGVGTGLGLPVILGITQQAGAHITVESAPGAGSTFRVYFPRSYDTEDSPTAVARAHTELRGTETVLVVEDEAALLTLARRTLESYGYHVLPARGPGEALLLAEKHPGEIALLLTDVVMPNMNGRDLYERVSRMRPAIKIVYMSGYPADVVVGRGELDPGTPYLQKPFTPTALATRVRAALD